MLVANGGMRINLQGEPVAPVTPEGEAHAQERMARILANREARAQQATAPVPVAAESVKAGPTVMVKKRRKVV